MDNRLDKLQGKLARTIEDFEAVELKFFGLRPRVIRIEEILKAKAVHDNELFEELTKVHNQIRQRESEEKAKAEQLSLKKEQERFNHASTVKLTRASLQLNRDLTMANKKITIVGNGFARLTRDQKSEYVSGLLSDAQDAQEQARDLDKLNQQLFPARANVRAYPLVGKEYGHVRKTVSEKYPKAQNFSQDLLGEFHKTSIQLSHYRDNMEYLSKKMIALQAKVDKIKQNIANQKTRVA